MGLWSARRRILALDGGGVRGIVTIAFLEAIERRLKSERPSGNFRLADHFDMVGGTSTGAIIAAGIATGRSVSEIKSLYMEIAPRIFRRRWHVPYVQARFFSRHLEKVLENEFGDMTLSDTRIRTKIAIVMKRIDTGSPWIVSNIPSQHYWDDRADSGRIGNRHYKLATLIRASTAAPFYFGPQQIAISADVIGSFVDGGVSPHNSPVLPLLMLSTMRGFGLGWPFGVDDLSIISIGTGRRRSGVQHTRKPAVVFAGRALESLIEDCQSLALILMQWMSEPESPWHINREIGTLEGDLLGDRALMSFQRYDLVLEANWIKKELGLNISESALRELGRLDNVASMNNLYALASEAARRQIKDPGTAPI